MAGRSACIAALACTVSLAGCGGQSSKPSELRAATKRLTMLVEQESHGRDSVEIVSKASLRQAIKRYQTLQRALKAAFSGPIVPGPCKLARCAPVSQSAPQSR